MGGGGGATIHTSLNLGGIVKHRPTWLNYRATMPCVTLTADTPGRNSFGGIITNIRRFK